jgi:phosphomannomutase
MPDHHLDKSILREYDIRGIVGQTLHAVDAAALGRAFGTLIRRSGGRSCALGRDGRISSPQLAKAFARGLKAAGIDVYRIGIGPTPMLYFAEHHLPTDAAAMVTGSHNPADYNGFKLVLQGRTIHGTDILELGRVVRDGTYSSGNGRTLRRSVLGAYTMRLLRDAELARPLSVAWDPGNGAACPVIERMVRNLPGRHIVLNGEVDGSFPAHHPDPTLPETLEHLRHTVLTRDCDLGIAFDGDGDRLGVIDNRGNILWGDQLMMLWSEDILRRQPGATIIADVKTSQSLFDTVERLGGKPVMWRTGHSLIKAKMRETGAALAGEMSGHIFFADRYFGFDDALYAAIRLLNLVARGSRSLADLHDRLPKSVATPELRIDCDDIRKFAIVDEVRRRLQAMGADVNDIDGVRVRTGDGWWLLRASNTQNALVARCEASDAAGLERLKASLAEQLLSSSMSDGQIRSVLGDAGDSAKSKTASHPPRVSAVA